jgi:hypothetical protein
MQEKKDESYVKIHNVESCSICQITGMDMVRKKIQFKKNKNMVLFTLFLTYLKQIV